MKILLYFEKKTDEDGTEQSCWVACLLDKAITGRAPTAPFALKNFITWLKASVAASDNRVGDIYAMRQPPPTDPLGEWPFCFPEEATCSAPEKSRAEHEALWKGVPEEVLARLEWPEPVPVFPESSPEVRVMWNKSRPISFSSVEVPEGWEARLYEQE